MTATKRSDAQPLSATLMQMAQSVRWRDLDAFGHVNNSSYLTYVEEARLQWFESLGADWISDRFAPVLAASQLNFRRQLEWPEALHVTLLLQRAGTTSLTLEHRIASQHEPERIYCDGHSVLVWIDRQSGKPIALPPAIRNALAAYI